jgi:hypothetical protein
MDKWVSILVSILSGLAVCIPLVSKLVTYVQKAVKEKNWAKLVSMLTGYISEAEQKFTDGATRKQWVLAMIQTSAKEINYDLDAADLNNISKMIDELVDMTKVVNVPKETVTETK